LIRTLLESPQSLPCSQEFAIAPGCTATFVLAARDLTINRRVGCDR